MNSAVIWIVVALGLAVPLSADAVWPSPPSRSSLSCSPAYAA